MFNHPVRYVVCQREMIREECPLVIVRRLRVSPHWRPNMVVDETHGPDRLARREPLCLSNAIRQKIRVEALRVVVKPGIIHHRERHNIHHDKLREQVESHPRFTVRVRPPVDCTGWFASGVRVVFHFSDKRVTWLQEPARFLRIHIKHDQSMQLARREKVPV